MEEGSRPARAGLFSRVGGFTRVAWVFVLLVSWLSARTAFANSTPLPVSFAGTGQALPQAEIRVAIATELGRETLAETEVQDASDNRERVMVTVDELGQLWVRYWGPRGLVDRRLPMPARPEQVPLVVSLSVGNLVRQEAFELLRDIERRRAEQAKASESAAEPTTKAVAPSSTAAATALSPQPALPRRPRAPVPRPGARPKNSWGHFLVGDFAYIPSVSRVCSPENDDVCYDRNLEPISYDVEGAGLAGGINAAHGRYVMGYSRALLPDLWASVRVGFAFSGGNVNKAAAERDSAASKFMPWLFELRLQHFFARGAFNGALRPFVQVAAGVSEEAAELELSAPSAGDGKPIEGITDRSPVTLVHAMGLLFAGAGFGGSLTVFEPLRLEVELTGFVAFPSTGWFARPSVGLAYDF
jgi:hypothetical protein